MAHESENASGGDASSDDPYARSEYRRLIAWTERIRREGPFLTALLKRAPERAILDIGCGTGEHTAHFARSGARAVGIDRSEDMIEKAREYESHGEGRFILGEAVDAPRLLEGEAPFGLALCLGNMLPHLLKEHELDALFGAMREILAPGGFFVAQLLNYRKILDQEIRYLPLNFREGDGNEEIVFVRLMTLDGDQRILFFPTTLVLDPDSPEPVTVRRSRRVVLRPWKPEEITPCLERARFRTEFFGDMEGGSFAPAESHDLVIVAQRE